MVRIMKTYTFEDYKKINTTVIEKPFQIVLGDNDYTIIQRLKNGIKEIDVNFGHNENLTLYLKPNDNVVYRCNNEGRYTKTAMILETK